MNFHCFRCEEIFSSSKEAISHLKKIHFMIDNTDPIQCVVKNCTKTYSTFKALALHLKKFDHQIVRDVRLLLVILKEKVSKIINYLIFRSLKSKVSLNR